MVGILGFRNSKRWQRGVAGRSPPRMLPAVTSSPTSCARATPRVPVDLVAGFWSWREGVEGGLDEVLGVGGAVGLGEDVGDADELEDRGGRSMPAAATPVPGRAGTEHGPEPAPLRPSTVWGTVLPLRLILNICLREASLVPFSTARRGKLRWPCRSRCRSWPLAVADDDESAEGEGAAAP